MNDHSVCMFSVLFIIWAACKLLPPETEINLEWSGFLSWLDLFVHIYV